MYLLFLSSHDKIIILIDYYSISQVQDYLMAEHNVSQSKSGLLASLVGGLFAAVPSHPFDVVKTCMQQDIKQNKYTTFSNTVNILYKEV